MLFIDLVGCIIDAIVPDDIAPGIDRVEGRNTQIKTDDAVPFTIFYVRGDGWKNIRESRLYERDELLTFLADQLPPRAHTKQATAKHAKPRQAVKSDAPSKPAAGQHFETGGHVADSQE